MENFGISIGMMGKILFMRVWMEELLIYTKKKKKIYPNAYIIHKSVASLDHMALASL